MLYCTLILPYLNYCVEVWGNTYASNITPLFLLQKRAIRVIHKVGYREPSNRFFISSGLLKLTDIIKLQSLKIMYKAKNRALPKHIQNMFKLEEEENRLKHDFKHTFARLSVKQMCISVAGVKLWHSQSTELKSCTSTSHLKRVFKREKINAYKNEERDKE